jgi:type IV secretion system protein VirB8
MMLGKKNATPSIENAVSKAVNYELTIADIARRSERRAWFVAFGAILMSLILAGGYFYMLPLKEKVPFMVMADAYTGTSTIARLEENFDFRKITASEAFNRSNVAHFVLARESYDSRLLNQRDWTTVYTMSSPDVAAGFTALRSRNNLSSPYNVYGTNRAIRVKILSIVLIGDSAKAAPKGATVRFQRSLYEKSSGASSPLDSKIATLEFTYKSNLKMDEEDRIENPMGFQVTSYRVDTDFAASPPVETEAPQMQAAPASAAVMPAQPAADGAMPGMQEASADAAMPATAGSQRMPPAPAPTHNVNGASDR